MTEICKSVPIPEDLKNGNQRKAHYPLGEMDPGDSLFLPTHEEFLRARAATYPLVRKHHPDWKFAGRFVEEEKGWRLWRIR